MTLCGESWSLKLSWGYTLITLDGLVQHSSLVTLVGGLEKAICIMLPDGYIDMVPNRCCGDGLTAATRKLGSGRGRRDAVASCPVPDEASRRRVRCQDPTCAPSEAPRCKCMGALQSLCFPS